MGPVIQVKTIHDFFPAATIFIVSKMRSRLAVWIVKQMVTVNRQGIGISVLDKIKNKGMYGERCGFARPLF